MHAHGRSIWQGPLGKFATGCGGLFARSDHMAFLDCLFDHGFKVGASSAANTQPIEMLGLRSGENLVLDFLRPGIARLEAERQRHVAGAALAEPDSGNLYDFVHIGKSEFVFDLDAEQYLAIWIERPDVSLLQILIVRDSPDLGCGCRAMGAAAALLQSSWTDALFAIGIADCFYKGFHCAGGGCVAQQDPVDAGGQYLLEHPRVGAYCGFIGSPDRDIHDHGGRSMAGSSGSARGESLHVSRKSRYIVRSGFHVVADVIGPGLGVLLTLLESADRAGMRSGVVNRLALFQQLDGSVDSFRFWRLRYARNVINEQAGTYGYANQCRLACAGDIEMLHDLSPLVR